jgi:DNA topoisomerase-1
LLDQLVHNGVIVPDKEPWRGLTIVARGRTITLSPHQEEMALAFCRKKGTPYVDDPVFVANFMRDWSVDLGIQPDLRLEEVDLASVDAVVAAERAAKEALTKEERQELAAQRREVREQLKARYGYAIVNGQRVELGTYMVEPSGIFMGRGQHPLRGRWKEGAAIQDITLNYGPHPEELQSAWAEVVWQPESLWVARWKDKLTDKLKYIWLSDTAPIKQEREESKFNKAVALDAEIDAVRAHIARGLVSDDDQRRRIATAVYLIDALCLRVGDEKDEAEEADTVGATTLRQEHLTFHDDGSIEFRFLGKDSVEWHKMLTPVEEAWRNLQFLAQAAPPLRASGQTAGDRADDVDGDVEDDDEALDPSSGVDGSPQLFPDVTSSHVNTYLSEAMPGLSAKVFRTHHATRTVQDSLESSGVAAPDPEYQKWRAASTANLVAAELCNHTKQTKGSWATARERYQQRIAKGKERVARYDAQVADSRAALAALRDESKAQVAAAATPERAKSVRARYQKRIETAQRQVEAARGRKERAQDAVGKIRAQMEIAREKRTWNTSTSLKSYIDPRVYHRWGERVGYDVLRSYYPATLQRKFAWVRAAGQDANLADIELEIRPCLPAHLVAVADFFSHVGAEYRDLALPTQPADVARGFLPRLEEDWRAARVILGEEREVLGFIAVGPLWLDGAQRHLDLTVVLDTDVRPKGLASAVAAEVASCVEAFEAQQPRKRGETEVLLRPRNRAWLAYTPELEATLALDEPAADDTDDGDG